MTKSNFQDYFQHSFWLLLSLSVPVYFGLISLHHALSQDFIIQDDARLHIVWLQQFVDPDLFPNDVIAHYYQTIQASGFKGLYWLIAKLGIEPLQLAKLLPMPLALVTTSYLFQFSLHLLPHPASAFLITLLLNQNIWFKDDLISATPRAFIYPLLAAFLYYLTQRRFLLCLILIGLTGLFYPQMVLVELGMLAWRKIKWGLAGLIVAVLVIWPYQQSVAQEFGQILSAAEMQQMPEFGPNGRREYFGVDPISFVFRGASGLRLPLFPPILWIGVALPFLKRRLVARISPQIRWPVELLVELLVELSLVSVALFLLAHLLFPRLYLPSRYTFYSFRVVMAVAAGIVLFLALEAGEHWRRRVEPNFSNRIKVGLVAMLLAIITIVPAVPALFLSGQGWIIGTQPNLYRFLARQPKATLIASLAPETDNLPAFCQRSVLVSRELALAYHPAFYQTMQQRILDLIQAQYGPNLSETQTILQRYGIDFLILDQQFAEPNYLTQQDWLIHSSFQSAVLETISRLRQGQIPALNSVKQRCRVLSENNLIILDAKCINGIESESTQVSSQV
jgi:hypothetical protein